jgi:hypothetical protein
VKRKLALLTRYAHMRPSAQDADAPNISTVLAPVDAILRARRHPSDLNNLFVLAWATRALNLQPCPSPEPAFGQQLIASLRTVGSAVSSQIGTAVTVVVQGRIKTLRNIVPYLATRLLAPHAHTSV